MGLGSFPALGLKDAREMVADLHATVRQGEDPIRNRETERAVQKRNLHILAHVTTDCFEARKAELRGDGKALPHIADGSRVQSIIDELERRFEKNAESK